MLAQNYRVGPLIFQAFGKDFREQGSLHPRFSYARIFSKTACALDPVCFKKDIFSPKAGWKRNLFTERAAAPCTYAQLKIFYARSPRPCGGLLRCQIMVCCSQGSCCSTQSEQVYVLEELICLNNVILVKQNVRENIAAFWCTSLN